MGRLAQARRLGRDARRAIEEKVDDWRDDLSDGAVRVGGAMEQMERTLKYFVRNRPWQTLAIGVSVEVFIEDVQHRPLSDFAQIEGEGKLRVDAGYTNVQFSGRVTEAEKAFKAATFGLKRVDGKDLVVASARVHNMVLATAEAAFHPAVDDIEDERRVHADGRVQCRGRLPRSVAHTCDEPADRPRRLQR